MFVLRAALTWGVLGEGLVRRATVAIEAAGTEGTQISCGEPAGDSGAVKRRFDGLRDTGRITQCSKRDVCLLMRELDMNYYNRAVAGELDGAGESRRVYVEDGTCDGYERGLRMEPLSAAECKKEAGRTGSFKTVSRDNQPSGCYQVTYGGTTKFRFNTAATSVEARVEYREEDDTAGRGYKRAWAQTTKFTYKVVCDEVKRSLPDEALYFSPYKLKEQMAADRAQYNTACSPGMMAQLYRDGLTSSPCAEVLSFTPKKKYRQATDALAAGDLKYAEALMQDNVLFDVITNHWCPDSWADVDTCPVSRAGFQDKLSIREESCLGIADELLADITDGLDATKPPDFYRDVPGVGSGEHYGHQGGHRNRVGHGARREDSWLATEVQGDKKRIADLERRVRELERAHR